MRRRHYVSFNIPRHDSERIRAALASIGCDQWWRPAPNERGLPSFENTFESDDSRLALVLDLARQEEFRPWERVDDVYTDDELRSFPLLHLMVERNEIDPFGPSHGTTFDLSSACPRCGTGAVQTSPFYGPAKSFPKTGLICASSTETFVAEPLADALRRAETTGLELRQARSHREHEPLPWWQIVPRFTMPKMSQATKGIVHDQKLPPCPQCGRDGHYHTASEPEQIAYASADVEADELPDVVQTWECFSRSGIDPDDFRRSRFADPAILVKPGVFDIFRRMKVKHARFQPVWIVGE